MVYKCNDFRFASTPAKEVYCNYDDKDKLAEYLDKNKTYKKPELVNIIKKLEREYFPRHLNISLDSKCFTGEIIPKLSELMGHIKEILNKVHVPPGVIDWVNVNDKKRKEMFGSVSGGSGSKKPENFQRNKVIEGTGIPCPKTNTRINLRTNELKDISRPGIHDDGFDYSEDFDGYQKVMICNVMSSHIYLNFKSACTSGGGQTRTLKEVYHFIEGQLRVLNKGTNNIYFANILDGDVCERTSRYFKYLCNLPEYRDVKDRVYVGNLCGYFDWFKNTIKKTIVDK
jgi:hypothetical protein